MFLFQCCYYLLRRKYNFPRRYLVEYNYFIAPGVDAGLPIDTRNKRRDKSAWDSAKGTINIWNPEFLPWEDPRPHGLQTTFHMVEGQVPDAKLYRLHRNRFHHYNEPSCPSAEGPVPPSLWAKLCRSAEGQVPPSQCTKLTVSRGTGSSCPKLLQCIRANFTNIFEVEYHYAIE